VASKKRSILYVLGFVVYGFVVFAVYLYLTFPYDLVRQRLVEQFNRLGVRLTIGEMRPGWLPGLEMRHIRVQANQASAAGDLLRLQALRILPASFPFLADRWRIRLEGVLYDGRLQGTVRLPAANGTDTWGIAGHVSHLQLGQYALLQQQDSPFLRGRLTGEVEMTLDPQGQIRQGRVDLRLDSVAFDGQSLQLPLPRTITCDSGQAQLELMPHQMQITSFSCQGNDLALQARGTVSLRQPLDRSVLNLRLQLQSETVYRQEIALLGELVNQRPDRQGLLRFSIRGTFQRPRVGA
jgi:type II secretion system protein N